MNVNSVIEKCVGCGNCAITCPHELISMSANSKGFLTPDVNLSKCNNCGLCVLKCPAAQNSERAAEAFCEQVYSAWASDVDIVQNSASGGVFYLIAKSILNMGGLVCGAVYSEKSHGVKHILSDQENEVQRMRGSKYSQSTLDDVIPQIKMALSEGKTVLFSGTPCEIDACNLFLGKSYNNFYTISLICHGPISPIILDAYISNKEHQHGSAVTFYSMRYKNRGKISPLFYRMEFENGDYEKGNFYNSAYGKIFSSNLALREACYSCKYKQSPYLGDIILGDFKGIEHTVLRNNKAGVSAVIINSKKGESLWELIKAEIRYEKSELYVVEKWNQRLCRAVEHPEQSLIHQFWETFEREGINAAAQSVYKKRSLFQKIIIKIKTILLSIAKGFKMLFIKH